MTELESMAPTSPPTTQPRDGEVTAAHIVYVCYALSCLTGISWWVPIASIVSIAGVIGLVIAYVKRGDTVGTWLDSHFRWQIRTFWFAFLWTVIGWVLVVTVIGIVVGVPLLIATTVWLIYRIARGWWRLINRTAAPLPA